MTNFKHVHLSFLYQVLIQRRLQQHLFIEIYDISCLETSVRLEGNGDFILIFSKYSL